MFGLFRSRLRLFWLSRLLLWMSRLQIVPCVFRMHTAAAAPAEHRLRRHRALAIGIFR
jgi:hypothetical protein